MNDAAPQMRVRFDVEFSNGRTGHKKLRERRPKPKEDTPPAPSRVARLLALAHHFDDMIREGIVQDQAEIARLMKVTRAWVTRIMNLLYLAPGIQEAILFLTATNESPTLTMRQLQPLAGEIDWEEQRARWASICPTDVSVPSPHDACDEVLGVGKDGKRAKT